MATSLIGQVKDRTALEFIKHQSGGNQASRYRRYESREKPFHSFLITSCWARANRMVSGIKCTRRQFEAAPGLLIYAPTCRAVHLPGLSLQAFEIGPLGLLVPHLLAALFRLF